VGRSREGQQTIFYFRPYCRSFCHRLLLLGHEASNKITGQVKMKIFPALRVNIVKVYLSLFSLYECSKIVFCVLVDCLYIWMEHITPAYEAKVENYCS